MKTNYFRTALAAALITASSLLWGNGSVTAAPAIAFPVKALQQMVASSGVRVVKTVEQLPPDVRARFQERVRRIGEAESAKTHLIDMANPGRPWNAGDNMVVGRPNRQIEFAGISGNNCFVVFNKGSFRGAMQLVALFDLRANKTRLAGVTSVYSRCTDLAGFRRTVRSDQFVKGTGRASASF